jgi:hypothetical protein
MQIPVSLRPDPDGYTGRECPTCEKYFKIKFGTGLPDATACHCPYCNHVGPQTEFFTKQQIEYAQSVALNKISRELLSKMKRMERRPDPRALISIGITVKGSPTRIAYYSEKQLEERLICSSCTLAYTIYGAFGYCPDCGIHNSLQIVNANFDLVLKTLDLAKAAPPDVATRLVENALEDAISGFDGFGREHCAKLPYRLSFQSIDGAKERLQRECGLDISASLANTQWNFVCEQFQKRHLLAHKMGIADADYVAKTGVSASLIGRKIAISEDDVRSLVNHLRVVANTLYHGITRT